MPQVQTSCEQQCSETHQTRERINKVDRFRHLDEWLDGISLGHVCLQESQTKKSNVIKGKESVFLLLKKGKHFPFFSAPFIFSNTQSFFLQNQLEAEQEQEHFSGTKHFSGPINFRYFFLFCFLYVFIFFFIDL